MGRVYVSPKKERILKRLETRACVQADEENLICDLVTLRHLVATAGSSAETRKRGEFHSYPESEEPDIPTIFSFLWIAARGLELSELGGDEDVGGVRPAPSGCPAAFDPFQPSSHECTWYALQVVNPI